MLKLLLDENIGLDIQQDLSSLDTRSIRDMGWLGKKNGELMKLITQENFDIFITTDKNLPFQQNLANLTYALWVLDTPSNKISVLKSFIPEILSKINQITDTNLPINQKPKCILEYISVAGISTGKKIYQP